MPADGRYQGHGISRRAGPPRGQPARQFGYQNDQMNELFNEAVRAPATAQANQYWGQAQDLTAQDMPMVPIVNSNPPGAYSPKVHGFVPAGNGCFFYNSVWIQ